MEHVKEIDVSVILPTRNNCTSLGKTLEMLEKQVEGAFTWELLIVDNLSTDQTKTVVESFIARFNGRLKYLFEKVQGISQARNRGILESRGKILIFTDDDCRPEPDWLREMVRTFHENNAQAVVGRIVLKIPEDFEPTFDPEILQKRFAHVDYGDTTRQIFTEDLVGANMGFTREILDRYGYFNPHFIFKYNQDTELSVRLMRKNVRRFYCATAVTNHYPSLNRVSRWAFMRQSFWWGRSAVYLEYRDISDVRYLGYLIKSFLINTLSLIIHVLSSDQKSKIALECAWAGLWGRIWQMTIIIFQKIIGKKEKVL